MREFGEYGGGEPLVDFDPAAPHGLAHQRTAYRSPPMKAPSWAASAISRTGARRWSPMRTIRLMPTARTATVATVRISVRASASGRKPKRACTA
ncbi:hypothetical protein ACFZDK_46955 [Streptomyces sp. NPDC007901]|uniref:hypothetical protein n=1 Tax=Streptomyces sp. NPDC007901 TaxID=3364785 RepID=UPI0036E0D61E